jgi:tetratricopeptide (TPR) repeat protein
MGAAMKQDDAKLMRVASHCLNGQCVEAISVLEELVRNQPADPELHHQLGMCYSGACKPHAFVSIRVAVSYFEHALSLIGSCGPFSLRAKYLDSLGNACLQDRRPEDTIRHLSEAAELYATLELRDDWAREQYNLGNAFCEVGESDVPRKWQFAVEHYLQALTVRTKERDPVRFAATVQNLGTAYRELPAGDRRSTVRAAIGCYHCAMRVYQPGSFPAQHAALHNNLGNAYLCLPGAPDASRRNIRRALRHFERALEIRQRDRRPCDYAATQFNRGRAYTRQAELDPGAGFDEAVRCFREAEKCFLVCRDSEHAAAARAELARLDTALRQKHI